MKRLLKTLALISLSTPVFAYDGIVIVLEAPLLREPNLSSKVVQTIRKGQRVYIPNETLKAGSLPDFVPTFDRTGNRAYIPSKYIKVITGTTEENKMPISLAGNDPTDYRLEEPIPSTYPFENRSFLRASASFVMANNTKSPYAYGSAFDEQDYKTEMGVRLAFTRKVTHDKNDRFYFGAIAFITSAKNYIDFTGDQTAQESRDMIRLGPWFTYDAFKSEKYRLAIGTGFTFNYHRTTLFVDSPTIGEERLFSGFSLSPMTSSTFEITEFFPNTDILLGVDMSLFMPHTLKTKDQAENLTLWNGGDQISQGVKAQASAFLGVQVRY